MAFVDGHTIGAMAAIGLGFVGVGVGTSVLLDRHGDAMFSGQAVMPTLFGGMGLLLAPAGAGAGIEYGIRTVNGDPVAVAGYIGLLVGLGIGGALNLRGGGGAVSDARSGASNA